MMKTIVTLIMNPTIDKNSIDDASSSASGEKFVYQCGKAFMTSGNSDVRLLKAPFFDGVVVSVKTESQVFP